MDSIISRLDGYEPDMDIASLKSRKTLESFTQQMLVISMFFTPLEGNAQHPHYYIKADVTYPVAGVVDEGDINSLIDVEDFKSFKADLKDDEYLKDRYSNFSIKTYIRYGAEGRVAKLHATFTCTGETVSVVRLDNNGYVKIPDIGLLRGAHNAMREEKEKNKNKDRLTQGFIITIILAIIISGAFLGKGLIESKRLETDLANKKFFQQYTYTNTPEKVIILENELQNCYAEKISNRNATQSTEGVRRGCQSYVREAFGRDLYDTGEKD